MAPPKIKTRGRRSPQQERSKVTVDAILEAGAHILVTEGYDKTSTNKIAKKAGVSIGSLYQYFPSKEAVVAALVDEHIDEMWGIISEHIAQHPTQTIEETVRALITALIEAKRLNPRLHKVFVEQVPRLGQLHRVLDINKRISEMVKLALSVRPEALRPADLDIASFLVVHAVQSVTHALAVERPDYLDHDDLVDELTALVVRYLVA